MKFPAPKRSSQLISFIASERGKSNKPSLIAALLSALIWILVLPVWLGVVVLYEAHVIFLSRKLGVSATALGPMSMRWLQHQLGLRRDEACAKLIKVLPNHSYMGLSNFRFFFVSEVKTKWSVFRRLLVRSSKNF